MSDVPPSLTLSAAQPPFYVGVDIGGTNVKIGLVDDLGRTITDLCIPTGVEAGPDSTSRRIGAAMLQMISEIGLAPTYIARVGLVTPGWQDMQNGLILAPHNLPNWHGFPIRERVSQYCGLPVTFANDANAAAFGESWVGAGREFRTLVLLTLGTGIGGGIILEDYTVQGENGHGAECGHIVIDYHPNARVCGCGQTGHLEAYASATAVIKRTSEALESGRKSSLIERMNNHDELTPILICEEAEAGDALSLEIILETARFIGIGAVSLIHTIDPTGVLLGGAMTFGGESSPLGRRFLDEVRAEVRRRNLPGSAARTRIEFAALGGNAGYIGAAGLARFEYRRK
ncbi:MAG: ROK family protein [Planctomycetota bacterium]|nr:ROK family protein [Planctomycetota bacterium]